MSYAAPTPHHPGFDKLCVVHKSALGRYWMLVLEPASIVVPFALYFVYILFVLVMKFSLAMSIAGTLSRLVFILFHMLSYG